MNGMDRGPEMDDELLSAWLDGELSDDQHAALGAVLEGDPAHRAALAELDQTRALVRRMPMQEPPAGFRASLLEEPITSVTHLDAARARRRPDPLADRHGARRVTAAVAGIAAVAAVVIAVVVPGVTRVQPALATDVRVHQAGVAASGDPVSGLAPLAHPPRFGR